ncbi:hypothetical protein Trydic_g15139 [Trypoxylus dichotomus]
MTPSRRIKVSLICVASAVKEGFRKNIPEHYADLTKSIVALITTTARNSISEVKVAGDLPLLYIRSGTKPVPENRINLFSPHETSGGDGGGRIAATPCERLKLLFDSKCERKVLMVKLPVGKIVIVALPDEFNEEPSLSGFSSSALELEHHDSVNSKDLCRVCEGLLGLML